jgi:hypothetical protein
VHSAAAGGECCYKSSGENRTVSAEVFQRMGLKGDKSAEKSVSNALTALTKSNQVSRREGKYVIGG